VATSYGFQIRSYTYLEIGHDRLQDMATIAPEIPALARDEAFEKLYRRYVKDVYHYALALLRNPADAEDVTQTTFMNAYRAYQRGDEIRKPQNWLIKIAHNVARTRYARISRRVKEVPLDDHVDQLAVPEEDRPNIEGVLRALGRLPFNQRAALIMRELEGRSYTEIADTLAVSVPAVETLIFRARRSLKVRTAALRSILTVPVPSSLAQFFDGGAVAAGGFGAGVVAKAVIALVAGAIATGVVSDGRNDTAVASPAEAKPMDVQHVTVQTVATQRAAQARARIVARVGSAKARAARHTSRVGVSRRTSTHSAAPTAGAAVQPSSAASTAPASPSNATQTVTQTVSDTTDTVVGTVDQTVATVTTALPQVTVTVPPLPVQPPPLPKLP
jgi:RNA polymerase sigma factor (sigma-70 family)